MVVEHFKQLNETKERLKNFSISIFERTVRQTLLKSNSRRETSEQRVVNETFVDQMRWLNIRAIL